MKPNVNLIGILAAGHLVIDMNQGALPALWISALLPIPGFLASIFLPRPWSQG